MLQVSSLNVSYSALQVLWDVNLEISKGEIVTLLGSNGAGKTTLVSSILGFTPASSGNVTFKQKEILGEPPYDIVREGLSLVPEKRELFPRMTVLENLTLGSYFRKENSGTDEIFHLFPALKEAKDRNAGTLSGGQQQMLAIARCLMSKPDMVILDEPSLGLSPKFVHTVLEAVQSLNEEGLTILLVEQNVRLALEISDRGYILENGRIVKSGTAEMFLEDESVKEAYLGI